MMELQFSIGGINEVITICENINFTTITSTNHKGRNVNETVVSCVNWIHVIKIGTI